jgi:predicted nucleotidyltransferase
VALGRDQVEQIVRRFVERVRNKMPVEEVYVFGSYADGTPTDDSDIDVAVISPVFSSDYWTHLKMLSRARHPDALRIEPIGFSVEHRQSPPRGSLLREILRTGWRVV